MIHKSLLQLGEDRCHVGDLLHQRHSFLRRLVSVQTQLGLDVVYHHLKMARFALAFLLDHGHGVGEVLVVFITVLLEFPQFTSEVNEVLVDT